MNYNDAIISFYKNKRKGLIVVYDNKVLLRMHDKYGIWLGVGGHIELDEDPNQAAVREVKEEVGLEIKLYHEGIHPLTKEEGYQELIPPQFMNRHRINPNHEHVTLVYFATSDTDKIIQPKKERSKSCRWFLKEEIDETKYEIKEHIKMYAKSALEKLADNLVSSINSS